VSPWLVAPAASLLIGVCGMLGAMITSRALGPDGRGILAAAMIWTNLVINAGSFVNTQTVVYFLGRRSDDRPQEVRQALIALPTLLSVLLPLIAWIVNRIVIRDVAAAVPALTFLLFAPISLWTSLYAGALLANLHSVRFWGARVAGAVVLLGSVIVLGAIHRLTPFTCVVATVAGGVATLIASLTASPVSLRTGWRLRSPSTLAVMSYGAKTNVVGLPANLNARLDQLLMSLYLAPSVLGIYTVAVAWSMILSFVGNGTSSIVLGFASRGSSVDAAARSHLTLRMRTATTVLLFVAGVLCILAKPLIPAVFGVPFRGAVAPAIILCLAAVPLNLNLSLHELLRGNGFPGIGLIGEATGLAVSLVMLVTLLPSMGGTGAALASLVSYSIVSLILLYSVRHAMGVHIGDLLALRGVEIQELLRRVASLTRQRSRAD
jgi:O-antigen/teichoic acid export membrane protein